MAIGIAGLIVVVVLLIPVGGLGLISVLAGETAGLTSNMFTITLAIVAGCVFLLALFYLISLIAVPAMPRRIRFIFSQHVIVLWQIIFIRRQFLQSRRVPSRSADGGRFLPAQSKRRPRMHFTIR